MSTLFLGLFLNMGTSKKALGISIYANQFIYGKIGVGYCGASPILLRGLI
jgi:hypothetical protein